MRGGDERRCKDGNARRWEETRDKRKAIENKGGQGNYVERTKIL